MKLTKEKLLHYQINDSIDMLRLGRIKLYKIKKEQSNKTD